MATRFSTNTMETTPTYEFKDEAPPPRRSGSGRNRHHHNNNDHDVDPTDGSGSLTYSSAASSTNSAAGESTDSSFADIMKVLDGQESSREIAMYLQHKELRRQDERSIAGEESLTYSTNAESLAYSTDAESMMRSLVTEGDSSALHGADLISTATGHTSEQHRDHNIHRSQQDETVAMNDHDILFSPAEHTDSIKRRKDRKKQRMRDRNATPRVKNTKPHSHFPSSSSAVTHPSSTASTASTTESRQGTPPTPRQHRPPTTPQENIEMVVEEEDVWYAKWWMFCFPDTVKSMTPKR